MKSFSFIYATPPTQPPLAAGLGKCVLIIHYEAFKMGVGAGGFNEIDFLQCAHADEGPWRLAAATGWATRTKAHPTPPTRFPRSLGHELNTSSWRSTQRV